MYLKKKIMQFYQEKLLDIFTINYYIVKAQI